jgi:hypothetical protein
MQRKKCAGGIGALLCRILAIRKADCSTFLSAFVPWNMAAEFGRFVLIALMNGGISRVCQ